MKIKENNIINFLNSLYKIAIDGLPGTPPIEQEVKEYLNNDNKEEAIDSIIRWATAKNSVAGFISSVGGVITLPISVPAEVAASLYIQLRMIAKIAHICGHDVKSDKVKTVIYCCLIGNECMNILKEAGVKIGQKLTIKIISSINGKILLKINKLVGFRLFTKFGTKGILNLGKTVPFLGGLIGGSINGIWTYKTGNTAKKLFFKKVNDK